MRSALAPRFSLNHIQTRTVLTITAFEKAMQELRGDRWKETLNIKQKTYVEYKENRREFTAKKMQAELGDKWEAAAAQQAAEQYASPVFQNKLRDLKAKLSQ